MISVLFCKSACLEVKQFVLPFDICGTDQRTEKQSCLLFIDSPPHEWGLFYVSRNRWLHFLSPRFSSRHTRKLLQRSEQVKGSVCSPSVQCSMCVSLTCLGKFFSILPLSFTNRCFRNFSNIRIDFETPRLPLTLTGTIYLFRIQREIFKM